MFFFGQNTGSNSPRFLHPLQDAAKRGVQIITFNPVREKGLETFVNPQNPAEMLTGKETRISNQYHQVKIGGDIAVMLGICKRVFAADDKAKIEGKRVLDVPFIEAHTHGFEEFEAKVRSTSWDDIEAASGLGRAAIEAAAQVYVEADRVIGIYGMGLTQHVHGFENIAMFVNLLMLKAISAATEPASRRFAAIRTCRVSEPSAFQKSPNSCRWTNMQNSSALSRRARRA